VHAATSVKPLYMCAAWRLHFILHAARGNSADILNGGNERHKVSKKQAWQDAHMSDCVCILAAARMNSIATLEEDDVIVCQVPHVNLLGGLRKARCLDLGNEHFRA
jgi:hypothetical protein